MPIVVNDLHHAYNPGTPMQTPSLRGVSLTVEEGAFVALVGTMGSGKSTLIQHLNGLIIPPPGAVAVDGLDVGEAAHLLDVRRRVGVVFQYPEQQLFADTVYADVAFGPCNLGLSEDEVEVRVRQALASVGLDCDEIRDRSPWSLSGGQQRRVALAGVLAMRPRYLVLDEPTVGLDPEGRLELLELLQRWRREQAGAIVLATHHLDDAARLATHVVVLSGGRVALSGPPEQVLAAERAEELRGLGLDVPPAARLVEELRLRGWELPDGIVTEEAAVAAVRRAWARRRPTGEADDAGAGNEAPDPQREGAVSGGTGDADGSGVGRGNGAPGRNSPPREVHGKHHVS